MPATALRCRNCATEHPLEQLAVCSKCLAPLAPTYDWEALARTVSRESIASGPPSLWRYAPLLPVEAPAEQRLAPGLTPLLPAPRLAAEVGVAELWLKCDTANPTHSFKDRVVAVAAAKAKELGLGTLACSSTGNLANAVGARAAAEGLEAVVLCPTDLEPEKLLATAVYGTTIYAVRGTYDDCSRLSLELSFELDWGFVNVGLRAYYAEGSKTLAYEIAEQLGWEEPDVVVGPIASGALFGKVGQGFGELRRLGLVNGSGPRLVGGQPEGCAPVATAFAEGARARPVRPRRWPARSRSATLPTPTWHSQQRGGSGGEVMPCPRTRSASTWVSWRKRPESSERRRPVLRSAPSGPRLLAATLASPTGSSCSSRATG